MAQIPRGAAGTVAGVLIYSLVCLLGSVLMIWLTWHHRERTSYVAFLAYFLTLGTVCSIIQQIHDLTWYEDIAYRQFEHLKANLTNPELVISNGAVGIDLVLYYIQFYCYNVQALFVMFWAWQLVQSVHKLGDNPKFKRSLMIVNRGGKVFSIFAPLVTVLSLQSDGARSNFEGFLLLAGQPLIWSIAFGSIALAIVFFRYVHSQRRFKRWSLMEPASSGTSGSKLQQKSMYDRWLLTRFTIAFIILSGFELAIVLFSITARGNLEADSLATEPDLTANRAHVSFLLRMPGVTGGLLLFIVFGTTKTCMEYMQSRIFPGSRDIVTSRGFTPSPTPMALSPRSSTRSKHKALSPQRSNQTLNQQRSLQSLRQPVHPSPLWATAGHGHNHSRSNSRDELRPSGSREGREGRDGSRSAHRHKTSKSQTDIKLMKPLPPTPEMQEIIIARDLELGLRAYDAPQPLPVPRPLYQPLYQPPGRQKYPTLQ